MERIVLTADEGMVYTDGINGGKVVYLAIGQLADGWWQVTEEEFEKALEDGTPVGEATDEDYQSALRDLGVDV